MKVQLEEYFEALARLKANKPRIVSKYSPINLDTVAIEAGKSKGTIRRSRNVFEPVIEAIERANLGEQSPQQVMQAKVEELKGKVLQYRILYEESLAREISLVKQLWDERETWAKEKEALTGENVVSIFKKYLGRSR